MQVAKNIESLRNLSQILSPANFKKIVKDRNYFDTFYRISKHTKISDSTTNFEVINAIYKFNSTIRI